MAGVDEVGRARSPVRSEWPPPEGLDDSKALCEAERDALRPVIFAKALSVSIASASAQEIDGYNIRGAALRAMARAVRALSVKPHLALIDRRDIPDGLGCPARAIIGGDAPLDVDRRRLDHCQDDPRRAYAQLGPRASAISLYDCASPSCVWRLPAPAHIIGAHFGSR